MAGRGSRFAKAGYQLPKPFIEINGKPMIEVVVNNLRPSISHRFIFICQRNHLQKYNAESLLHKLSKDSIIIPVDTVTDGQLSSAMLAEEYIDKNEPLLTANTDQFIDFRIDDFIKYANEQKLDGLIMTMKATDPKWSYVKLDVDNKFVVETAEKKVISDEATVGIYYFSKGRDFVECASELISNNERVNGEFYICPVYNYMICRKKKIGIYNIGTENHGMYGLGTPAVFV